MEKFDDEGKYIYMKLGICSLNDYVQELKHE